MRQTIFVIGGDGFCGWPTALHLSKLGNSVVILDNLSRRKIDLELGCQSLTPISSIYERVNKWNDLSDNKISFELIDVAEEKSRLIELLKQYQPDVLIHFGEQRAAPYSMKDTNTSHYTVKNNLLGTHNILEAMVHSGVEPSLVHLGTMGVYGYKTAGLNIPEGYLSVSVDTKHGEQNIDIVYPPDPGSVYHMTKVQDHIFFQFYSKNYGLRITDLHQGIVWGTNTEETNLDIALVNRFDYDGDFGTVLNRFLMQAAIGHPLTVHGSGGQTRAFIHIQDTVRCIELACQNPPVKGASVKVFNQVSETLRVRDLASLIANKTASEVRYYKNPRKEAAENDLVVSNTGFRALGWQPILLEDSLLDEVIQIAEKYQDRVNHSNILATSAWNKDQTIDLSGNIKRL